MSERLSLAPTNERVDSGRHNQGRGTLRRLIARAAIVGAGVVTAITGVAAAEAATGREAVAQADAFGGANGAEKAWCRWPSRWQLCNRAQQLSREATMAAEGVARDHGLALHNGGADAFRHCYWSGMMTDEFGWETAKGFGDRHEYNDEQHPGEAAMDFYNNRKGRVWAQEVEDIGARCLQGALDGELAGFPPFRW